MVALEHWITMTDAPQDHWNKDQSERLKDELAKATESDNQLRLGSPVPQPLWEDYVDEQGYA